MDKSLKKTLGWIFLSFSVLCLISLTGLFGKFGAVFNETCYGLFGQTLLSVYCILFVIGFSLIKDRYPIENKKLILFGALSCILLVLILDYFTTQEFISFKNPGQYLADVVNEGSGTAGGVVFSLILSIPLCFLKNTIPVILVLFASIFVCLFFMGKIIYEEKKDLFRQKRKEEKKPVDKKTEDDFAVYNDYVETEQSKHVETKTDYEGSGFSEVKEGAGYGLFDEDYYTNKDRVSLSNLSSSVVKNHFAEEETEEEDWDTQDEEELVSTDEERDYATVSSKDLAVSAVEIVEETAEEKGDVVTEMPIEKEPVVVEEIKKQPKAVNEATEEVEKTVKDERQNVSKPVEPGEFYGYLEDKIVAVDETYLQTLPDFEGQYNIPNPELFEESHNTEGISDEECLEYAKEIELTFQKIDYPAKFMNYIVGSSIIRYEYYCDDIKISNLTKPNNMTLLKSGLSPNLKTVQVPLQGKKFTVGIDVENPKRQTISFREMVMEKSFWEQKGVTFLVGKSADGTSYYCSVEELPHMLISGSSGSGKSVCVKSILASLMIKNSPKDLQIVVIDTKAQDFVQFENTPHMMFGNIIADNKVAKNVLEFLCKEVERRNELLRKFAVSKISELKNRKCNFSIPRIVIIFDEYNDMLANYPETEKAITAFVNKIAAVGRAVGVHLIICTQRPDADVINSVIKSNLTSRIALKVTDAANSAVALGSGSAADSPYKAHMLSGNGDLILKYQNIMENLQAPYITESDIYMLSNFIRNNNNYSLNAELIDSVNKVEEASPADFVQTAAPAPAGSLFKKPIYQQVKRFTMLAIYDTCCGTEQTGNVNVREVSYSVISTTITIGNTLIAPLIQWLTDVGAIASPANEKKKYFIVSREKFIEILDEYGNT